MGGATCIAPLLTRSCKPQQPAQTSRSVEAPPAYPNSGHVLRIVYGTIICKDGCFASMKVSKFAQEFGGKVRALRVARGMSQETLADTARGPAEGET